MRELILITGTSSGIGQLTALACAAKGHRVVATMRNLDKREELLKAAAERGVKIDVEHLDVTSEGVGAKVKELVLKYGPFYGLVNNAGIAIGGAFEEQTEEDVQEQFQTNVFGMMAVTRAILPSMRASQRGRIINVSSLSGRVALPLVSIYAATKHAVEGFSESLRWEVEAFGVDVCVVEPGTFKTAIFSDNQRRGRAVSDTGPYATLNRVVEKLILDEAGKAPPPDKVAEAILKIIEGSSPAFRTIVGNDARALVALRRMIPDRLFASGVRRLMNLPKKD